MPRQLIGPFQELSSLVVNEFSDTDTLLDCMDRVRNALESQGCKCVGSDLIPRDEDWGADISELVIRMIPHEVSTSNNEGIRETQLVSVKLSTLQAEIDSNGEVCAWIYQED